MSQDARVSSCVLGGEVRACRLRNRLLRIRNILHRVQFQDCFLGGLWCVERSRLADIVEIRRNRHVAPAVRIHDEAHGAWPFADDRLRVNRKVLWDRIASDPDKVALARALIERVPLWGWGEAVLSAASKAAFDDLTKWRQISPRGARDAIWFISEVSDASMKLPFLSALAPSMSTVIITRLNQNRHLKPFVRKVMRFDVLHPFQALSRMQRTSRVMFVRWPYPSSDLLLLGSRPEMFSIPPSSLSGCLIARMVTSSRNEQLVDLYAWSACHRAPLPHFVTAMRTHSPFAAHHKSGSYRGFIYRAFDADGPADRDPSYFEALKLLQCNAM